MYRADTLNDKPVPGSCLSPIDRRAYFCAISVSCRLPGADRVGTGGVLFAEARTGLPHCRGGVRRSASEGPHVLWSSCDFSDRWWTTPFSVGRCWPRSTPVGRVSQRSAMQIRTCFVLPSSMDVAATWCAPSAARSSSRWCPGCSARSWGHCPGRRERRTSSSASRRLRRSSRSMWSRCVGRAVGTTSSSPMSSGPFPRPNNPVVRDRVPVNRTVEQRVSDTIAPLIPSTENSTRPPKLLEIRT